MCVMNSAPKKKVALFLGNDITSCIILNSVVPEMKRRGYEPVLVLPEHKSSDKANLPKTQELAFVERKILNNVYHYFLQRHNLNHARILTPALLAEREGLEIIRDNASKDTISNVNAPNIVDWIKSDPELAGAFSIRCFHIFKRPIIQAMKERGAFFVNMHPGILPWLKGVMTTYWAQAVSPALNKWIAPQFGWTAHLVDEGIDTGPVLGLRGRYFKKDQTGLSATIESADMCVGLIGSVLDTHMVGDVVTGTPQNKGEGQYLSYFTEADYKEWDKKGLPPFFRDAEIIGLYVSLLGDRVSQTLKDELKDEIVTVLERYRRSLSVAYTKTVQGGGGSGANDNNGGADSYDCSAGSPATSAHPVYP